MCLLEKKASMPVNITFLGTLSPEATQHEKEQQRAVALRHASIVSHQRRREAGLRKPFPHVTDACALYTRCRSASVCSAVKRLEKDHYVSPRQAVHRIANGIEGDDNDDDEDLAVQVFYHVLCNRDFSHLVHSCHQFSPFYKFRHGSSKSVSEAFEFFIYAVMPNNSPVYTIFNVSNIYGTHWFDLAQAARILHIWAATVLLLRVFIAPSSASTRSVYVHQREAVMQLRDKMSDSNFQPDDHDIYFVLLAAYVARLNGDLTAHKMHCQCLQRLVQARGGLNALSPDGFLKSVILQLEAFWTPLDTGRSIFDGGIRERLWPEYPDRPFLPSILVKIRCLPDGFQRIALEGNLAVDVIELLTRIVDAQNTEGRSCFNGGKVQVAWERGSHDDFWSACRCLGDPRPGLEKFLCLTLLLYCTNQYTHRRLERRGLNIYGWPRSYLTQELPKFTSNHSTYKECLVWMWMVVIDSWSSDTLIPGQLTRRGADLFFKLQASIESCTSWDYLQRVSGEFFFPTALASTCRGYFDQFSEMEERRSDSRILFEDGP